MPAPCPSTGSSPKASTATRQNSLRPLPEKSVMWPAELLGGCRSGLVKRSQARPPTASAATIASTAAASAIPFSSRGLRETARARPVKRALAPLEPAEPGEQQRRQQRAGGEDRQHFVALGGDMGIVEVLGEAAVALRRQ